MKLLSPTVALLDIIPHQIQGVMELLSTLGGVRLER